VAKKTNAVMKNFFIISLVGDGLLTFRIESAGFLAVLSPIRTRFDLVDKCILLGVNKRLKKPLNFSRAQDITSHGELWNPAHKNACRRDLRFPPHRSNKALPAFPARDPERF